VSDWAWQQRERLLPEVERNQEELREAIEELQEVVQRRLDVTRKIGERPLPWMIGGLLFGFWLGRSFFSR